MYFSIFFLPAIFYFQFTHIIYQQKFFAMKLLHSLLAALSLFISVTASAGVNPAASTIQLDTVLKSSGSIDQ